MNWANVIKGPVCQEPGLVWMSAGSWGLTGSRLFSEFNKELEMSFLSFWGMMRGLLT
jgi:hypothetical protein